MFSNLIKLVLNQCLNHLTPLTFGKAAIGMMAVLPKLERETIVERVREGKRKLLQGRFMGGPIALGYKIQS